MTDKTREALDKLVAAIDPTDYAQHPKPLSSALAAARAVLSEPAQSVEPVPIMNDTGANGEFVFRPPSAAPELTDEQIEEIWNSLWHLDGPRRRVRLVRAILAAAQEKKT